MGNIRFIVLVAAAAALSFFAVRWLSPSLQRDARLPTFHSVEVDFKDPLKQPPAVGDGNETREALRQAALTAAEDLATNACDSGNKYRYVEAASAYARAWQSVAPCMASNTCNSRAGEKQMDRLDKEFGTSLDRRVRTAMMNAHMTGAVNARDFGDDVRLAMASLAADPSFNNGTNGEVRQRVFGGTPNCTVGAR